MMEYKLTLVAQQLKNWILSRNGSACFVEVICVANVMDENASNKKVA